METKTYQLPVMVVNRYVQSTNSVIRRKNRTQGCDNIPELTEEDVIHCISELDSNNSTLLKKEMSTCWQAFFDEVEGRVFDLLDEYLNIKLD